MIRLINKLLCVFLSVSAANAQIYERILVQKTMTQLHHYNYVHAEGIYTRPTLDLFYMNKYWGYLTKGMSDEQLEDFGDAKKKLENYEKIYEIVEYASAINDHMTVLERRIMTNNPAMPQNMWRACPGNTFDKVFPDLEKMLQAYYDLMDDCEQFPLWKRKLEEDLGGVVSFMAI